MWGAVPFSRRMLRAHRIPKFFDVLFPSLVLALAYPDHREHRLGRVLTAVFDRQKVVYTPEHVSSKTSGAEKNPTVAYALVYSSSRKSDRATSLVAECALVYVSSMKRVGELW